MSVPSQENGVARAIPSLEIAEHFRTSDERWPAAISRFLTVLSENAAALLVLAELVLLFSGVAARYLYQASSSWSDEVASLLFVWLTMLGATVAFSRNQHLRLTVLEDNLSPGNAQLLRMVNTLIGFLFLIWLAVYSLDYSRNALFSRNAMLDISDGWRASALATGLWLMSSLSLLQLFKLAERSLKKMMLAIALVTLGASLVLVLSISTGGHRDLLIFFILLGSACVLIGVPIAFAFGLIAIGFLAWTSSIPLSVVCDRFEAGMSHIILLSVPMFIFLGLLFEMTGIAKSVIAFLATLVGHVRGGLSYVLLGSMYLVSGISGAKAADLAAIAPAIVPEMRKHGVPDSELISLLAASSAMSETIPPSLVLITIGVTTGVSIGALFTGGLLPALTLALLLCFVAWFNSRRNGVSVAERSTWAQCLTAFIVAIPGLILPLIIRTAVVEGIATATEVATIGIIYTGLVGMLLQRQFNLRLAYQLLKNTASLSGAILFILGAASSVSWALTQTGFSQDLAQTIADAPGGRFSFMVLSIAIFIVFGSLLEGIPAIVVFGPLLFPIARSLGIHEVQYAMVAVLAMGIGLYTPPFGIGYYMACAISGINPRAGMVRIWPYLGVLVIGVFLIAAVPWISIGFLAP